MILFIDNYDSFVYNIVQYVGGINPDLVVLRNDMTCISDIKKINPDRIIISPGSGHPQNAGISCQIIEHYFDRIPLLGICLGHQAIATVFGADVSRADQPVHGKASRIFHNGNDVLTGMSNPFLAGRYHSLTVREESLPKELKVTAYTSSGEIMGIRHREYPVYGLQFHPESVLTPNGHRIIENFLNGED